MDISTQETRRLQYSKIGLFQRFPGMTRHSFGLELGRDAAEDLLQLAAKTFDCERFF